MDYEKAIEFFDKLILDEGLDDLWNRLGRHHLVSQMHSSWVAYFFLEAIEILEERNELPVFTERRDRMVLGALIHDIGKESINPECLAMEREPTPEELQYMQRGHVVYGSKLLKAFEDIRPFAEGHHPAYSPKRFKKDLLRPWQVFGITVLTMCDISDRLLRGFNGLSVPNSGTIRFIKSELKMIFPCEEEIIEAVICVADRYANSLLVRAKIGDSE